MQLLSCTLQHKGHTETPCCICLLHLSLALAQAHLLPESRVNKVLPAVSMFNISMLAASL